MIHFSGIRFEASPEAVKRFNWLIENRELIEFCMDAGLPLPIYQSSDNTQTPTPKVIKGGEASPPLKVKNGAD